MNMYELGVIVKPGLENETLNAEMERIEGLIGRFGGVIEKVDNWGKRRLAYPIAKSTEGVYTFITFTSESNVPAEIGSRLRIMENVLRFMIIRIEEKHQYGLAKADISDEPDSPDSNENEPDSNESDSSEPDSNEPDSSQTESEKPELEVLFVIDMD